MAEGTEARYRQAVDMHRRGDWQGAASGYAEILVAEPRHRGALSMSGALALQAGQPQTAIEILSRAVEVDPGEPTLHFHLGLAAQQLGSLEIARGCYETALVLKPAYREAMENLAVVLRDLDEPERALDLCEQALVLAPDSELALANAGTLALNLGRDSTALDYFDTSLARFPFNANIHLKRSQVLLRDGRFADAWDAYEWRFVAGDYLESNRPVTAHFPVWHWDATNTQHVLVTAEQGLGDEIMFAGCIRDLVARGMRVTLQCHSKLRTLFSRSFPNVAVIDDDTPLDNVVADSRIACGSLPRVFRRTEAAFGTGDPYLQADPARVQYWQGWLAENGGANPVGIAWSGGRDARAQRARSIPLADLLEAVDDGERCIVALQYGAAADDIGELSDALRRRVRIAPGLDPWNDVDELAALCVALGEVITVDNTIAHLAGALGVAVTVMLPVSAERRWLRDRPTTPWYRSMRLARQSANDPGNWSPVLADLVDHPALPCFSGSSSDERQAATVTLRRPSRRAVLLNDTAGGYHWGCTLTSNGLVKELRELDYDVDAIALADVAEAIDFAALAESPALLSDAGLAAYLERAPMLRKRLARADCVIVNGEGTLHGTGSQAATLLYLMDAAQRVLGKAVSVINHSCYPPTDDGPLHAFARQYYLRVYSGLADIAVREPVSLRQLAADGIAARQAFDCLPLALPQLDVEDHRRIVIGGSAAVTDDVVGALAAFVQRATANGWDCNYLYGAAGTPADDDHRLGTALAIRTRGRLSVTYAESERAWLSEIAGARLLVSGRFHHTLAAACVGTPFLVGASNTAKIAGLLETLDADDAFVPWQLIGSEDGFAMATGRCRPAAGGLTEPTSLETLKHQSRANFLRIAAGL
ncbi:MAG: polysaccharide pyruvyl transferase family protein [Pseudomonadota bacterium]